MVLDGLVVDGAVVWSGWVLLDGVVEFCVVDGVVVFCWSVVDVVDVVD